MACMSHCLLSNQLEHVCKLNWPFASLEQALYPIKHITWCVYALFIDDEEHIKRDCKYTVTKVSGNRAISLGGYLWAVSSIKREQLQVRCLEETHVIEIEPPLQIVYLGNGCEGYSASMFLPAKNEMTTHAQIESRQEYFLQFNYVYTPDRYIGLWWQFRTRLMLDKDARAFITQVAPLGTMDYSLLQKRPPIIDTKYGFSLPGSSNNACNRDSSNNTIGSWSSAWFLCISDGKNPQFGNGNYQESN